MNASVKPGGSNPKPSLAASSSAAGHSSGNRSSRSNRRMHRLWSGGEAQKLNRSADRAEVPIRQRPPGLRVRKDQSIAVPQRQQEQPFSEMDGIVQPAAAGIEEHRRAINVVDSHQASAAAVDEIEQPCSWFVAHTVAADVSTHQELAAARRVDAADVALGKDREECPAGVIRTRAVQMSELHVVGNVMLRQRGRLVEVVVGPVSTRREPPSTN